jgi:hypothetical protein
MKKVRNTNCHGNGRAGEVFMWNRIADLWCRKMHREAMWPIHGRYICKRCLREHQVDWLGRDAPAQESTEESDSAAWLAEHR